jgi:nanoRNase/pAp phosphatase (c-di-AMP/oligoRNAs hydrolase)
MIPKNKLEELRKYLDNAHRPLYFFDSDSDGLASFLLFYRHVREGKGVIVNNKPLSEEYARKVDEYQPDVVFVLDVPDVDQEFFDKIKVPVIWLDHHPILDRKGVKYYNPRLWDDSDNRPTAFWAYQVVKRNLWIAMAGIIGDYSLELVKEFKKAYPDLLPDNIKKPGDALFKSKFSKIIQIFNFCLKGSVSDAMKSVKILTRVDDPNELLEKESARARFVYKKFERVLQEYDALRKRVPISKSRFLIFKYVPGKYALSGELSNELLERNPDKIVIVAREKEDEVAMSLRSRDVKIVDRLQNVIKKIGGRGGGHDLACGAMIHKRDWEEFVELFKRQF